MNENIMIVGVGGQGTLLAARLIGEAAMQAGYEVKVSEVHGMAQRGGSVVCYVRFGDDIHSPLVEKGDADTVIAFELLEALRWSGYLKKKGTMIVNLQKIAPMSVITGENAYPDGIPERIKKISLSSYFISALDVAKDCGNIKVANSVLLGLYAAKRPMIAIEYWLSAIEEIIPQRLQQININAFKRGYNS